MPNNRSGGHQLDDFDRAIVVALTNDGSLTNVDLSEKVHLSASQISRRRAVLEKAGIIRGYRAEIDYELLGQPISAITRLTLDTHTPDGADELTKAVNRYPEVVKADVVTGDADYVLSIRVSSLDDLAEFIHSKLLTLAAVRQVRSEVILKSLKR